MTVSEGRRMHTKSLRRIINLLKGRPNININFFFVWNFRGTNEATIAFQHFLWRIPH